MASLGAPGLREPARRLAVQAARPRRGLVAQLGPQQVPDEWVVRVRLASVPARAAGDHVHEDAGLGEFAQRRRGLPRAREDDCELGVEDVDDARRQQEVADPGRLRVQHLGAEVEGDVGAGEVDGIVELAAAAVLDADQPQARRPPPGPVREGEHGRVGQLRLASGEQLPRLVGGEGELGEPDLGDATGRGGTAAAGGWGRPW